jgi:hypothetical protein
MLQMNENKPAANLASRPFIASMASFVVMIFGMRFWINDVCAEEKTTTFGVTPAGWPPYPIVQQDHISGVAVDVLSNIATHLGYEMKVLEFPEKRAHRKIET